ncbi:unnamed protein product [Schistosoma margrebowiei]|uniref:Uncharacterized protein n=1 Tax=Schistosoma margrebowiei TaxID=48269 RepID=A0AA85AHG6_9TREM|nr:unnamed protein product [Schistosoma margrebowiei]
MIWNNTMNISQKTISRLFKTLGKLSYRQVNTLSDDINQVVLLGKVTFLHLSESANDKNVYASIGLVTKNNYMTANGYSSTLAFHTVFVFKQSFVDKVKHLTKGDRLCIIGQLNSYSNPNGYWRSSVTAEIVSPLTGLSTVDTDDDVIQAEKVEEDEEILTDEMNDKFDTEK